MQLLNEFLKPTETLVLPVTKGGNTAVSVGSTSAPMFFYAEVKPRTKPVKPVAVDIDDLVAEFQSKSDANARVMSKGRQWVAETFYKDRPNLAQLRLKKGWSQLELAQKASTSQSYVARLEQGKVDPQISTVRRIAEALEVSIEVFAEALLLEAKP
jgi:ribosome-binding protein aMBF1 (putative translation factor)